jgi:hypothetical protein
MKLREMVVRLLTVESLERAERQMLQLTLDVNGPGPLKGLLHDEVEDHVEGRYQWFFDADGKRRTR